MKLWGSPFPVMLQTFLTKRSLKRHWSTPRALGSSRYLGTRTIKAFGHSKCTYTLGQSRHLTLAHPKHLGTRRTLGYSGNQALRHLSIWGTHLRLSKIISLLTGKNIKVNDLFIYWILFIICECVNGYHIVISL